MRTVVLLLTDVVGSTRLWASEHAPMNVAMARHHELVHALVAEHDGWRPTDQGEGDAVFAAFLSASSAVACAAAVQQAFATERWATSVPLTVRIGVHVGEVEERDGNLWGDPVNRCARLRGLGSGGQTLLSAPVYELVRDKLPDGVTVLDLGEHRMRDLTRPERVWQLAGAGLSGDFPALASLDRARHNLPVQTSSFVGREHDLAAVVGLLQTERLVTLVGFGGMGKTRLALQAAAELADGEGDGVWFVDLAALTDASLVPVEVAQVLGVAEGGSGPAAAVISWLADKRLLLVLDNLEQVLDCASFVADLLAAAPDVTVLATSREPLRIRGEQEVSLQPLPLPVPGEASDLETLTTFASVQLFVDRAVSVRRDFVVTNTNAAAVAAICSQLDGHPLAIELAAARVKMLSPEALLARLEQALSVLTGGGRDRPARHQTLRATIAWSYDALDPDEQRLLDRMSVFAGQADLTAVEAVCGDSALDAFAALEALVDKSLVRVRYDEAGEPWYQLLVSIRQFAGDHLAQRGETAELTTRHTEHYLGLAEDGQWDIDRYVRSLVPHLPELRFVLDRVCQSGDAARISAIPVLITLPFQASGRLSESEERIETMLGLGLPVHVQRVVLHAHRSWGRDYLLGRGGGSPDLVQMLVEAQATGDPGHLAMATVFQLRRPDLTPEEVLALTADAEGRIAALTVPSDPPLAWMKGVYANAASIALLYLDPLRSLQHCQNTVGQTPDLARLREIGARVQLGQVAQCQDALAPLLASGRDPDGSVTRRPLLAEMTAVVRLLAGDLEASRAAAQGAMAASEDLGIKSGATPCRLLLADLDLLEDRHAERSAALEAALVAAAGSDAQREAVQWRIARAHRLAGEHAVAEALLTAAFAVLFPLRVGFLPDVIGCWVQRVLLLEDDQQALRELALLHAERRQVFLPAGVEEDLSELLERLTRSAGPESVAAALKLAPVA